MIFMEMKGGIIMPFVEAKCTNCGAVLPVDSARDAWVCGYCGTPYMVNLFGNDTADVLYNRALEWLNLKNEAKAIQVLREMIEKHPGDVRGWSRLARLMPNEYNVSNANRLGDTAILKFFAAVEAEKQAKEQKEADAITRERETTAQVICEEIRNGLGEKYGLGGQWAGEVHIRDYNDCLCVQQLLKEGKDNADFFNSGLPSGDNFNRAVSSTIDRLWHVRTGYISQNAELIIGKFMSSFYYDEGYKVYQACVFDKIITKSEIQSAFQLIESRTKQRLCLWCGNELKTSRYRFYCVSCHFDKFSLEGESIKKKRCYCGKKIKPSSDTYCCPLCNFTVTSRYYDK